MKCKEYYSASTESNVNCVAPTTHQPLVDRIRDVLPYDDSVQQACKKLIAGMLRQIPALIAAGGIVIKY